MTEKTSDLPRKTRVRIDRQTDVLRGSPLRPFHGISRFTRKFPEYLVSQGQFKKHALTSMHFSIWKCFPMAPWELAIPLQDTRLIFIMGASSKKISCPGLPTWVPSPVLLAFRPLACRLIRAPRYAAVHSPKAASPDSSPHV
ncbi:hypothetical protein ACQV5M_19065, partial [Leptospira sp. SA-E8]|uniref:hypothetical protein n=1 Tax=Leptospira sp. SA-E8 TaxID=3422259 RepID=UPI003EB7E686